MDDGSQRGIPVLHRSHAAAIVLGVALYVSALTLVGAVVGFVGLPAATFVETRARFLGGIGALVMNFASAAIVFVVLAYVVTLGTKRPSSIWARNSQIVAAARLVAAIYLALIPVNWLLAEIRSFVQIQIGNATQVDMFSGWGAVLVAVGLPVLAIGLILTFAPNVVKGASAGT